MSFAYNYIIIWLKKPKIKTPTWAFKSWLGQLDSQAAYYMHHLNKTGAFLLTLK